MNEIGIAVVWCAVQVTGLTLFAAALYAVLKRWAPSAAGAIPFTTLLMVAGLSVFALSPWPAWTGWLVPADVGSDTSGNTSERVDVAESFSGGALPRTTARGRPLNGSKTDAPIENSDGDANSAEGLSPFWQALLQELQTSDQRVARPDRRKGRGSSLATPFVDSGRATQQRWPAIVAAGFLIGMAVGLIRLLVGLWAVRRYRRNSEIIHDHSLHELCEVLRAELGCRKTVALRESDRLVTAATVGWRRPVILLPKEWTSWTDPQRRAVLAHELAHVRRNDFLSCVAAQLGVVLHFYHPLVHWLCGRLRLEQEFAADAEAARLTGGQQPYLHTLADLALRQADRRLPLPARTFLPTRHTFMRRIEMLRNAKNLKASLSRTKRWTLVAVVLAVGIFVAGLRASPPPDGEGQIVAQQANEAERPVRTSTTETTSTIAQVTTDRPDAGTAQTEETTASAEATVDRPAFSLAWVPRDALVVLAARPARILQKPAFEKLAQALEPGRPMGQQLTALLGMPPSQIEQWTSVFLAKVEDGRAVPAPAGWIIQVTEASEPSELLKGFLPPPFEEHDYGPYRYHSSSKVPEQGPRLHKYAFVAPDKRTVIVTQNESAMRRMLAAREADATQAQDMNLWTSKGIADADIAGVIDVSRLRSGLQAAAQAAGPQVIGRESPLQSLRPLWEQSEQAAVGVRLDDELQATALAYCSDAEGARSVKETLEASVVLLQNLLSGLREDVSRRPNGEGLMMLRAIDTVDALLEDFAFKVQDSTIEPATEASSELQDFAFKGQATVIGEASIQADDAARLLAGLIPAVSPAREAALRTQCRNNLKQLAIAFHNYHDVYGHFPPAVVTHHGPNKLKHPHSWRVAILPFVEAAALYDKYNFDEPWDSKHNKKILEQMPAVFRHPGADEDSTNAAYFALAGPRTVFDGDKGTPVQKITDGTSNTILLVEAKREIPWTKPQDIPYDPDKELPKLGGFHDAGFYAAFCDGAVRFIAERIDEKILRLLITRNDGQPIRGDQRP